MARHAVVRKRPAISASVKVGPIVHIKPLGKERRGGFCCGVITIDNFFKNNAKKDHKNYKVRVFIAVAEGEECPVGFYSLCLTTYVPASVNGEAQAQFERVNAVPAVYLAMIGVREQYKGQGIGKQLMKDAFNRALNIAENAGTYALALDAYDESVAKYYEEKLGFSRFVEGNLKMFIPLSVLRSSK